MARIAIAIGDPNGIGPEIAVKAARAMRATNVETCLVGDPFVIDAQMGGAGLDISGVTALPKDAFQPGRLDPRAGAATIAYVTRAIEMAMAGEADAVFACPHSETAVNKAGIQFSGYAGIVADVTGTPRDRVFLMLCAQDLRIVHATLHESVSTALIRLSSDIVEHAGLAAMKTLERLGVTGRRLGLFGINPHAGEDGLFGTEDETIGKPAADRLRAQGFDVRGPVGADLLLSERDCDAYVAMFHDQGHIPIKLLSPLKAAALSVGSPVLFSSIAHGCAFDIAGKGIANADGVTDALALLAGCPT